jgi:protoporphyrinogen IX oxidase
MLWLKAFHIVFVVAWFVGLFALPRLFVYHATITDRAESERFKIMERRMFGMMTFAMLMATGFAVTMLIRAPGYLDMGWLRAKIPLVALLYAHHYGCYRIVIAFREDRSSHSQTWYRVFNELPFVLLIVIVVLATVKPF